MAVWKDASKIPFFAETENLVRRNIAWRDRGDAQKEIVKKMINIPNVVPLTPHGAFTFVREADICWVIFPYNSDEGTLFLVHSILFVVLILIQLKI